MPRLGKRFFRRIGTPRWPSSRPQTPPEMPDSLLTPEADSRSSLGWDYTSSFARPTAPVESRRSLSRSFRKLVGLNPLGQNPVTPHASKDGTSIRNSLATYFRRRSTASTSPSKNDVEDHPPLPPLPAMFQSSQPAATSISIESRQSGTDDFLRPPTVPDEVLPPAFHRSWCYRNSQISLASENSDARSFQSVPGWVKFCYPHQSRHERLASQSGSALIAPQATSPSSWLKAKFLRRSLLTVTSEEKGDIGDIETS